MFGLSEEERRKKKQREATRERVRRYRERKKGVTEPVTEKVTPVTDSKFVCACKYFVIRDGVLVCSRCGKPSNKKVEFKEA